MLKTASRRGTSSTVPQPGDPAEDEAPHDYWANMSRKLFHDVFEMDKQIAAFTHLQAADEAFPTELV